MKGAICFLALIALAVAADTTVTACPITSCDSSLDGCFASTASTNTIKIKKCDKGYYCANVSWDKVATDQNGTCTKIPDEPDTDTDEKIENMYPGYNCSANSQCASGSCGSNGCTGAASGADCIAWVPTPNADNNKMCGAGLWCSTDTNKCVAGLASGADCTATGQCSGRASCIGGKCVAMASIAKGDDCLLYYCSSGNYCSGAKCIAGTAYGTGTYGGLCTLNSDCAGDCQCPDVPTTKGQGTCGLNTQITPQEGISYWNSMRSTLAGTSYNCPLAIPKTSRGVFGCDGTLTEPSVSYSQDSCFNGFYWQGGLVTVKGSAFGLYASVAAFLAFLLA